EAPSAETVESLLASDPQRPLRIFGDGVDRTLRQPILRREARELRAADARQGTIAADPDAAVARLADGDRVIRRESILHRQSCERAVPLADRTAAERPDPQRAGAVFVHRVDALVGKGRRVARVEDFELDAVEADDAFHRAGPEIAVACLHDGAHHVLRQSLAPDIERIEIER